MAVPIVIGVIAAGSAIYGAVKGTSGAIDQSKARGMSNDAKSIVNKSSNKIELQREKTTKVIEGYGERKLRAFNGVISNFILSFEKLKNVEVVQTPELDKLSIGDFSAGSLISLRQDYQVLKDAGLGVGAGLGAGAALAFGAYNGTMMLATASTGAAITTLKGVAATNATLAWLGGGALTAGGGGVALGTMVIGGIVAGPAIAIFGHILGSKGEEALNNAYSNMEEARTIQAEAELMIDKLSAIEQVAVIANDSFSEVSKRLRRAVSELKNVINTQGGDYNNFSEQGRDVVVKSVKYAQLLKAMIDTPILDDDGNLVLSTEKKLHEIQALLN